MCLAVPGKIHSLTNDPLLGPMAEVNFGGALRQVSVAYVPEATVDDYVIVHAGCAISVLDEEAAMQVLAELEALEQCKPN